MTQRYPFRFPGTAHDPGKAHEPTTAWTPRAIPFGFLIALLGAWVIVAALIGPAFNFGFFSDSSVQDTEVAAEPQRERTVTAGT